jgi:invasion protein IalB
MKNYIISGIIGVVLASVPAFAQQANNSDGSSKTQSIQTAETGWQVVCRSATADRSKLACSMVYETYSASDRVRLASVEIVKAEKSRVMILSAPIGVSLKDGIELQADGAKLSQVAFSHCQSNGCFGSLELTDSMTNTLRKGKALSLSFADLQGSKIRSEISLAGFATAWTKSDDK